MDRPHVRLFISVVALALFVAPHAPAQETEARAKLVDELITLARLDVLGASEIVQSLGLGAAMAGESIDEEAAEEFMRMAVEDPSSRKMIRASYAPIIDQMFTDSQLREIVAFYKTPTGRQFAQLHVMLLTHGRSALMDRQVEALEEELASSKARRTMADIRSAATAAEAYATDYNLYPDGQLVSDLQKVLEPTYIRTLPVVDAWDQPMAYRSDRLRYRFVSGGPDGRIERSSLDLDATIPAVPSNDDIIYADGSFLQGAED